MNKNALVIHSITASELEIIEAAFPSGDATKHQSRFDMQMQDGANYLFAWFQGVPIGHVLLRWHGTLDEPIASSLRDCPHVEDLFVQKEYRSEGIGTTLLNAVESSVKERGFNRMGLAVGTENSNAKRLYERLGYVETSFGAFDSCWVEVDKHGESKEYRESVVYLVKRFG